MMDSLEIVKKSYKVLNDKQATDIKVMYVREQSSLADYFVICSASSQRQAIALSENIEYELEKNDVKAKSIEGLTTGRWILMDYYDVIIHIFVEEDREFYSLERLWQDAKMLDEDELK